MNCVKCGHEVSANFCPNCGHNTKATKFDGRYFLEKLISSVDISKGFFFTIIKLVVQPGVWLRRFILGEIAGFSNPLKMFLIVGAITNFLTFQYSIFTEETVDEGLFGFPLEDLVGYYNYSTKYFSFFTLTAMPFFALASWLLFRKSGFNFLENLVFNLYVGIGQFLLLLTMIPLMVTFNGETITTIYGAFNIGYNIWAILYFFQAFSWRGWVAGLMAVGIPQIAVYFINYVLYRLMPETFWLFLDQILG